MLSTTIDAIRAVLRMDPTVNPAERTRIIYLLRWGEKEKKAPVRKELRLLHRETVADRLACSLRLVDRLAVDGVLHRVMLPGRKRGAGFRESEVDALVMGTSGDEARPA
jgi:hypothetical protein